MINSVNKPEILAPCGSYDILTAAVKAGADACYIGGNRFGARAYAENLSSDSIIKAIDYAHLHGVKLYLTVNTLFKNKEIEELYSYLLPYYEAGIDAVIVQDLGVFALIRSIFPDVRIHCSTQMNINSIHAARFMKQQGATRVVLAREMSLSEIRAVKESADIEVETFVHGAMCYSYSGQCLMSSLAGGRSGNRGRCAQPCRKCYDGEYILSMKDMCALTLLPELIETGVDSLKIEGRMKNVYYVASAVDAYRQLRDDCVSGTFDMDKALRLKKRLANIYNRGGFCEGYFFQKNGADMISRDRPNNQGVCIGSVEQVLSGRLRIKLVEDMYKGDVLEIRLKDRTTMDITVGADGQRGSVVSIPAPKTKLVVPGQRVLRTRCSHIIKDIEESILDSRNVNRKLKLSGLFCAAVGEPLSFSLACDINGKRHEVTVYGPIAEYSDRPVECQKIREKLSQLGGTEYVFDSIEIQAKEDAFVPMSVVKTLRREAISALEDKVCGLYRRQAVDEYTARQMLVSMQKIPVREIQTKAQSERGLRIGVTTMEQLREVLRAADEFAGSSDIKGIYMSRALYDTAMSELKRDFESESESENGHLSDIIYKRGIKLYIELPYLIDSSFSLANYLPNDGIHGIYIRNIDGFAAVVDSELADRYELVCGASLYGMNDWARAFWITCAGPLVMELPRELNLAECAELATGTGESGEASLYGYQPVMLSAQCVVRSRAGCDKGNGISCITDDKGNRFYVRCICEECCNIIYNGIPFNMLGHMEELSERTGVGRYSIFFTFEDATRTSCIMRDIMENMFHKDTNVIQSNSKVYTTGHCYRGVE